jgi:hypothetical protein
VNANMRDKKVTDSFSCLQTFYVRDNGIDLSIINAVEAIVQCLRSEEQFCVNVPDEGQSMKSLGF